MARAFYAVVSELHPLDTTPFKETNMSFLMMLSTPVMAALLTCAGAQTAPVKDLPESFHDLPLHIERPSKNSVRLWVGDHLSSTAVAALSTDKGIVVIDTTAAPSLDKYFREIIARELGRNDFAYLINTHEHSDHTSGNGVYSDCEIIAHEACAKGIQENFEGLARRLAAYDEHIPELKAELEELDPESAEAKLTSERISRFSMLREDLKGDWKPTFPTRTFSESLTLDMGNMKIELYYMGGVHTASDIFVLAPEEGLLFTGDMMADEWFTESPGCLKSFAIRENITRNTPVLMKNWRKLLARKDEIKDYIPGHWNGDLQHKGFMERHDYVDVLHTGIALAIKEGRNITDILREFDARTKFPHLIRTPGFTVPGNHYNSVLAIYGDLTGMRSAINALRNELDEGRIKAIVAAVKADHAKSVRKYFYMEAGFNQLGYMYVAREKLDEALAVFKLATEFYPASWNSFDSLAECYKTTGALDLAESNYLKSIELNPENAVRVNPILKEIRDAKATAKADSKSSDTSS